MESPHEIRRSILIGTPLPLHIGANGKVLLAALPSEEREAVLAAALAEGPPLSPEAIADLKSELEATARQGYSITEGERVPRLALDDGGPVWDRPWRCHCVGRLGPDSRFPAEAAAAAVPCLLDMARRLTRQLGGHRPGPATLS